MFSIKKYTSLKSSGYQITKSFDHDHTLAEGDTKQCCHCGCHWTIKPGSGTVRGYCYIHNDLTCGHPNCDVCK